MNSIIFVYKKSLDRADETLLGLYSTDRLAEKAIKNYCEKYPKYFRKCFRLETRSIDVDYI